MDTTSWKCFLLIVIAAQVQVHTAIRIHVKLLRVVDGDTINVIPADEFASKINVRMRYIDAPERAQRYGKEATAFLSRLLGSLHTDQPLQLAYSKTDRYGRAIGVVYAGVEDVNRLMVANGYAWCYRNRCPDDYKKSLESARLNRLGLFKDSNPQTPWDYRKSKRRNSKSCSLTTDQVISKIPRRRALGRSAERIKVKLLKVSDGDTITVSPIGETKKMKVRFLFIDAPERSQDNGVEATNYLKSLLVGSRKSLVIKFKSKDKYKRTLGVVYLGRRDINKQMVATGYAWCYKMGCPKSYLTAMKTARKSARGLWEEKNPQAPWNYRKCGKRKPKFCREK